MLHPIQLLDQWYGQRYVPVVRQILSGTTFSGYCGRRNEIQIFYWYDLAQYHSPACSWLEQEQILSQEHA